jgi:hypothetical protein
MRRSTLVICALLTVATFGCDKVRPLVDKISAKIDQIRGKTPPPAPVAQQPDTTRRSGDTALAPGPGRTPRRPAPQRPAPPRPAGLPAPMRDVPYVSDDTGTIAPGMSEREIYALWGAPAAVRRVGEFTYLFFQNGCEYTCGTMDVVVLQNDQVVDAVLRWEGHRYSGESSSPPGRIPFANPGGDTLIIPTAPPPTS